jgi:hypothetical protein
VVWKVRNDFAVEPAAFFFRLEDLAMPEKLSAV